MRRPPEKYPPLIIFIYRHWAKVTFLAGVFVGWTLYRWVDQGSVFLDAVQGTIEWSTGLKLTGLFGLLAGGIVKKLFDRRSK